MALPVRVDNYRNKQLTPVIYQVGGSYAQARTEVQSSVS